VRRRLGDVSLGNPRHDCLFLRFSYL
jgi:hypothetical protein